METGDKNHGVTEGILRASCIFCEESLGKINAKEFEPEQFRSRILSLEIVDYFGTNEYFIGRKQGNLNEQNSDGEANWSGVVNFHCAQTSLVMSMRFIFGDD